MIQTALETHVMDPKNPYKCFELAKEYDQLEQGAMAVSLYLKSADLSDNKDLQYDCMVGVALCYDRQRDRGYTVEGALFDAIALDPTRTTAHYYLCKFYEGGAQWKKVLMHANTALQFEQSDKEYQDLLYYQALATWYICGQQNGKHLFFDLVHRHNLYPELKQKCIEKLDQIFYPDTIQYKHEDYERFKYTFQHLETIEKNYSKHFQDMFVLSAYNGKTSGSWLEIGSGDPFIHNNTALLEQFGWNGISIDNSEALCYNFKENRNSTVICADATEIGYADLFEKHLIGPVVDYLQIDCDEASIDILKRLPFDSVKFGVITFEHDSYRLGGERRDEARQILFKLGYELVVPNVGFTNIHPYEDWFIHPDVIDKDTIRKFQAPPVECNFVWDYFIEAAE